MYQNPQSAAQVADGTSKYNGKKQQNMSCINMGITQLQILPYTEWRSDFIMMYISIASELL